MTGCAAPATPDTSMEASSTASMKTVNALSTLLAEKPTYTPLPPTVTTAPPAATRTSTPLPVHTATPLPTVVTPWNTCDVAVFLSETISDKIVMDPGTLFVKTWTLQNSGTCVWNKDYRLVFESGDAMTEVLEVQFLKEKQTVEPGQQVTLHLSLISPTQPGNYLGFWKLANAKGERFGLGGEANPIWVNITVASPSAAVFNVTSAKAYTIPNSFKGACGKKGYTVTLMGKIKTNKAGTITYRWEGTDGAASSAAESIVFYGADEQDIFRTFTIKKGVHYGYAQLVVTAPNEKESEKATFSIECIQ